MTLTCPTCGHELKKSNIQMTVATILLTSVLFMVAVLSQSVLVTAGYLVFIAFPILLLLFRKTRKIAYFCTHCTNVFSREDLR